MSQHPLTQTPSTAETVPILSCWLSTLLQCFKSIAISWPLIIWPFCRACFVSVAWTFVFFLVSSTVCLSISESPCLSSLYSLHFLVFSHLESPISFNRTASPFYSYINHLLVEQISARLLPHSLDSNMRSRIIVLLAVCSNVVAAGPLRHNGARVPYVFTCRGCVRSSALTELKAS